MKKLAVILVLFILLTGCDNSIKHAKANRIRQATNRANDRHDIEMADSRALTPVRLRVKEVLLWSLMGSGMLVLISFSGAFAYFTIGASYYVIRDMRVQQIPLDVATRQYPLLIYGNGRRSFNPNNEERLRLSDGSAADPLRVKASNEVQLAGLISDGSKVINGKVKR